MPEERSPLHPRTKHNAKVSQARGPEQRNGTDIFLWPPGASAQCVMNGPPRGREHRSWSYQHRVRCSVLDYVVRN